MNKYSVFPQKTVHDSSFDAALIASMVLLVGLGLVTLYITSADYAGRMFDNPLYFVKRQALSIGAGLLFLLIFAWIDMDMLRKALPFIVSGLFILCFFRFLPGTNLRAERTFFKTSSSMISGFSTPISPPRRFIITSASSRSISPMFSRVF